MRPPEDSKLLLLKPTFGPRSDADSLELLRLKNDFMYSVFNKSLLSDMGKTIVRKHLFNMNAQGVWEEFVTHMTTSSKGKAEKHRLHTYVTTPVLDKSWKGTSLSSTSMSSSDNWMKSLPLRNFCPIPLD